MFMKFNHYTPSKARQLAVRHWELARISVPTSDDSGIDDLDYVIVSRKTKGKTEYMVLRTWYVNARLHAEVTGWTSVEYTAVLAQLVSHIVMSKEVAA